MKYSLSLSALALLGVASAQQTMWGQCGGIGWSGATNCVAGAACSTLNPYYAQCLSAQGQPTTTSSRTTTTPVRTTTTTSSTTTSRTTTPTSRTTTPISTTSSRTTTPTSRITTTTTSSTTTSRTTTGPVVNPGGTLTLTGNPFAGRTQYAGAYYSSEVYSLAVPSLIAAGKASLTAAAKAVATVPSFIWFDKIAAIPAATGYLNDIRAKRAAGQNIIGTFVIYNLPDRDCAALASNGELAIAQNGVQRYKTEYVDVLADIFAQYQDLPIALVIEPDSVANMITNMNVQKCQGAKTAYEECIRYTVTKFNTPNVAQYIDAGHAGWLGWPNNLAASGPYYANIYKGAGSPRALRGLATNVANYNAWSLSSCPAIAESNTICDEKKYINALHPLLQQNGWDARFIVDQGRSGKQPTGQVIWGDWCNVKGTGFGIRPDTPSPDPLLDAFVWIKPGGESDGTSNSSAVRYDAKCSSASSFTPAPEAGQWFQAFFEQLLVNSNPSFL